jgi:hypothetical protein
MHGLRVGDQGHGRKKTGIAAHEAGDPGFVFSGIC